MNSIILRMTVACVCALAFVSGCSTPPRAEGETTEAKVSVPTPPLTPDDPGFFAPPHENPRGKPSDRFPNTTLVGHDQTRYRFYDDLVRGKTVVIQFMYTSCTGI